MTQEYVVPSTTIHGYNPQHGYYGYETFEQLKAVLLDVLQRSRFATETGIIDLIADLPAMETYKDLVAYTANLWARGLGEFSPTRYDQSYSDYNYQVFMYTQTLNDRYELRFTWGFVPLSQDDSYYGTVAGDKFVLQAYVIDEKATEVVGFDKFLGRDVIRQYEVWIDWRL